jgi:hypothetical protein
MSGKNIAVFGIYHTREAAEEAVDAFRQAHFRNADVSALFPDNTGTKDLAHEKNTKAPEGATTGAASGAVAGGVLGWLAGIGALAIPGVGPLIAAGPIVAALAGAGALGTFGGIVGALAGMGIPEYEAKRFEGRIKHGGILLSVHCDDHDWSKRAEQILKRTGAEDISATREAHADFAVSDKPQPRTQTTIGGDPAIRHDEINQSGINQGQINQGGVNQGEINQREINHDELNPPRTRTAGGGTHEA